MGKFKNLKASIVSEKEAKKIGESQTKLCHVEDYAKIIEGLCSHSKVVGQGMT